MHLTENIEELRRELLVVLERCVQLRVRDFEENRWQVGDALVVAGGAVERKVDFAETRALCARETHHATTRIMHVRASTRVQQAHTCKKDSRTLPCIDFITLKVIMLSLP